MTFPPSPSSWSNVRRPALGLVVVIAIGLGLRLPHLTSPLQQDEFGPLYAIAERTAPPNTLPSAVAPLVLVSGWREVRTRSVLPYGIEQPVPLYHYGLYALLHFLPIAEWSLRLPSVLAGLACIAGMYGLCRRWLGTGAALGAALLVAVDPMQVAAGVIARPYALAGLGCVLSFLALGRLWHAQTHGSAFRSAAGYALALAFIGYLNAILLLVVFGHIGLALFWIYREIPSSPHKKKSLMPKKLSPTMVSRQVRPDSRCLGRVATACWWLAGCVLSLLLLAPQWGYWRQLQAFQEAHRDYLFRFGQVSLVTVLMHNSTFLLGLGLVLLVGVINLIASVGLPAVESVQQGEGGESTGSPAHPACHPYPDVLVCGLVWLVFPQLIALAAAYGASKPVYLDRYLSYTSLGGVLVLTYAASRFRDRLIRRPLVVMLVLLTFCWGFEPESIGVGMWTEDRYGQAVTQQLDALEEHRLWKEGDLVLFRPGFLEGDLRPDWIPPDSRFAVEGVLTAQLAILYPPRRSKPVLALSLSHRSVTGLATFAGRQYEPARFYNDTWGTELGHFRRCWVVSHPWDRAVFLQCLLEWLGRATGQEWQVLETWPPPTYPADPYPPVNVGPHARLLGLQGSTTFNYTQFVLINLKRP